MATRDRKLEFIASFGRDELASMASEMVRRHGADFLTDAQIDEITSMKVEEERWLRHHKIRNRERAMA